MPARPRHADRPGRPRPQDPADRRRAGRPGLRPARPPARRRASGPPWARRCSSTTRSSGRSSSGATTSSPFDEREMAIVTAFAGQAAMAVNGVKLVQQLEARGAELAKKVDELEALREVGEAVSSSLDVDHVLSTIAMHAVELSGTDGGSIMEYSERGPRASWSAASTGPSPSVVERLRSIRIDLDETLVGRAARERRPIAVPDLERRRARPAPADPLRRRLALAGRRPDAARGQDRRVADRPPQADRATSPRRRSTCWRRSRASRRSRCSTPSSTAS